MAHKINCVRDCKSSADFSRYAARNGWAIEGGGRHVKARKNGVSVALGHNSHEDLPIGTRKSIIRSFIMNGLTALLITGAAYAGFVWLIN